MPSGFIFNQIVIIQSLEPTEVKTGRMLHEFISTNNSFVATKIPIQVYDCGHAGQFLEIIIQLTHEAALGKIPLLHVECHGDPTEGLEFQNSSILRWEDIATALLPLNIASRFNLLAVFSACFGAHFLGQMGVINHAPCWCLVAPTETVDPGEILAGFRAFYSALFEYNDMGSAIKAISNHRPSQGYWLAEPAEIWFEKLITGYIETHCLESTARNRAKNMYRQLKIEGHHTGVGALLRLLRKQNREDLLGKYFERYFLTTQIPENIQRFQDVRQRTAKKLASLRSTGKYIV